VAVGADAYRDAAGLLAAKIEKDPWRVNIARQQGDAWAMLDALTDYLAIAFRDTDACHAELVIKSLSLGPGGFAHYDGGP
jgi:hypothetical protein